MTRKIERRVSDRGEEAASARWVWKVVALSLLVTAAAVYLFLKFSR